MSETEVWKRPLVVTTEIPRHWVGVVGKNGSAILDLERRLLHIFDEKGEYIGASALGPSPATDA